jgi:hypothetical protein
MQHARPSCRSASDSAFMRHVHSSSHRRHRDFILAVRNVPIDIRVSEHGKCLIVLTPALYTSSACEAPHRTDGVKQARRTKCSDAANTHSCMMMYRSRCMKCCIRIFDTPGCTAQLQRERRLNRARASVLKKYCNFHVNSVECTQSYDMMRVESRVKGGKEEGPSAAEQALMQGDRSLRERRVRTVREATGSAIHHDNVSR